MTAMSVLEKAASIIREREELYAGSANGRFERIAEIATVIGQYEVTPDAVALVLLALKLDRLHQNPKHEDSVVDAVNYMAFYGEELRKEKV